MGLGFSFGSKKNTGTGVSDSTQNQTINTNQTNSTSGLTQTDSTKTGTSLTNQNTTGTQTGVNQQNQTQSTTGKTTGTQTSLGQDVQDALAEKVKSILGNGISDSSIMSLQQQIGGLQNFDAEGFVNGLTQAAQAKGEKQLQQTVSQFGNGIGGSASTNSMAALMQTQGQQDLLATVAGITADAQATAADIMNKNATTSINGTSALAGIASALAGTLKGATTTTDTTQLTDEISALLGKTGQTNVQDSQTGTSSSEQQSQTQLLEQIAKMLGVQDSQTQTHETTTQKTKSGGFGLSLGL